MQIVFSPLRCDGLGLSDGEVMERIWSYLRRFSRMTKEMRPAHRVDILSHALLYYGFKTKQKLGNEELGNEFYAPMYVMYPDTNVKNDQPIRKDITITYYL